MIDTTLNFLKKKHLLFRYPGVCFVSHENTSHQILTGWHIILYNTDDKTLKAWNPRIVFKKVSKTDLVNHCQFSVICSEWASCLVIYLRSKIQLWIFWRKGSSSDIPVYVFQIVWNLILHNTYYKTLTTWCSGNIKQKTYKQTRLIIVKILQFVRVNFSLLLWRSYDMFLIHFQTKNTLFFLQRTLWITIE